MGAGMGQLKEIRNAFGEFRGVKRPSGTVLALKMEWVG